jgi:hypothetical protein
LITAFSSTRPLAGTGRRAALFFALRDLGIQHTPSSRKIAGMTLRAARARREAMLPLGTVCPLNRTRIDP